jgi:putative chitinase
MKLFPRWRKRSPEPAALPATAVTFPVPDVDPAPVSELPPAPRPTMITQAQYSAILAKRQPKLSPASLYAALLLTMDKYEINTPLRLEHFLAQTMMETSYFETVEENPNFKTMDRLVAVWPSRFSLDPFHPSKLYAGDYVRQPEKLANTAYANRFGNGDFHSGDGWRYRGRGSPHLTFKDNYRDASRRIYGDDRLVYHPELVAASAEAAYYVGGDYWHSRKINALADRDDARAVTAAINGATGKALDRVTAERQPYYTHVRACLRKTA